MIEFNICNQIITRKDSFRVVGDSRNYLTAAFEVSEEWKRPIVVLFGYGEQCFQVYLDDENRCKVPFEVIRPPFFTVSAFCGVDELVTANRVFVEVEKSGLVEGDMPETPTPSIFQQYVGEMHWLIENALPFVGENGNWFLYDKKTGAYCDSGTVAEGYTPQKGTDYWTEEDKEEIKDDISPFVVNVSSFTEEGECITDRTYNDTLKACNEEKTIIFKFVDENGYEGVVSPNSIQIDDNAIGFIVASAFTTWDAYVLYCKRDDSWRFYTNSMETNFSDPSADVPPTALSVKTYVDTAIDGIDKNGGESNIKNAVVKGYGNGGIVKAFNPLSVELIVCSTDHTTGELVSIGDTVKATYDTSDPENRAAGTYTYKGKEYQLKNTTSQDEIKTALGLADGERMCLKVQFESVEGIAVGMTYNHCFPFDSKQRYGKILAVEGNTIIVDGECPGIHRNYMAHGATFPITGTGYYGSFVINGGLIGEFEINYSEGLTLHSEGIKTYATVGGHSEGYGTKALSFAAHVEGENSVASGFGSHAEGAATEASGHQSHTEGELTKAFGYASHAEGQQSVAKGSTCHAEGNLTVASGRIAHSEGNNTKAEGNYSHAEGHYTVASGMASHAEGAGNTVISTYGHGEGYQNTVGQEEETEGVMTIKGRSAHAEGESNTAIGDFAHAEGRGVTASGTAAHAEGFSTEATGPQSHAEGYLSHAIGDRAHAEGNNTTASGTYSHSEGYATEASGQYTHSEGWLSVASGQVGHSEGYKTTASGRFSHAQGRETVAGGSAASAGGLGTIASGNNQTVVGKYNKSNSNMAVIVGKGSSDTDRSDAFTLDWGGNAVYSGTVKAGRTTADSDNDLVLVTKGYLKSYVEKTIAEALAAKGL